MTCKDCLDAKDRDYYPVYTVTCPECAQRMVMNQDCKLQRSMMAEYLEMRYQIATDWKKEPSCGCTNVCERRKIAQDAYHSKSNQVQSPRLSKP